MAEGSKELGVRVAGQLDSGDAHDDDKTSVENNKKRRLKTPTQVMALENFYNEHKYPSEKMKARMAEEIGLTEKQVSGWFCHRRLKDKRSLQEGNNIGRQDRSSVVIQDRGSGHRQDSCGSTKQMDYTNIEPREVESQRYYASQGIENVDGADSTSLESSSSLQERLAFRKNAICDDVETSRYPTRNGIITPSETHVRNYGYKPSGYLKLKGEVENAAIIAVKRQLGRHYWEDGPPLGVEFDPLPPGAFESTTTELVHEPIYVGNQRRSHHPLVRNNKNPNPGPRYDAQNSKVYCSTYVGYEENDNIRGKKSHQQPGLKSSARSYNSLTEKIKDSPLETLLCNSKKNRTDTNLMSPYDYDKYISKMGHKSIHLTESSNGVPASSMSPDSMDRGLSSGMAKYYGEMNPAKMHREKLLSIDEPPVPKRATESFLRQSFVSKALNNEMQEPKSQLKRSDLEIPSSFSDDETAETDSSMD